MTGVLFFFLSSHTMTKTCEISSQDLIVLHTSHFFPAILVLDTLSRFLFVIARAVLLSPWSATELCLGESEAQDDGLRAR